MDKVDSSPDKVIDNIRVQLRDTAPGSVEEADLVIELADALGERYQERMSGGNEAGADRDLDELITRLEALVSQGGPGEAWSTSAALGAGLAREERWMRSGDRADKDVAIGLLSSLLEDRDISQVTLCAVHNVLARLYADEAVGAGRDDPHLNKAIEHARSGLRALSSLMTAQPCMPATDVNAQIVAAELAATLGLTLAERYRTLFGVDVADSAEVTAARMDRDEAIGRLREALDGLEAHEPLWALVADGLGRALHDRFSDTWPDAAPPDPADLDASIDALSAAAAVETDARTMLYLVFAFSDRLELKGDPADRALYIHWSQLLLSCEQYAGPDGNFIREELSLALLDRAEHDPVTRRTDRAAAIELLETALATTGAQDPGRTSLVTALAQACWQELEGDASRYDDVDRMMSYAKQAWELLQPGDDDRVQIGLFIATGVHEQLLRPAATFDAQVVSDAIEVLTEIEPLLADDPHCHTLVVVILGHFLVSRGQETGSRTDVAAAQRWLLQGAAELPAGDPEWAEVTQTLAVGMTALAVLGMDADHLDQAIAVLETACARVDPDPVRAAITKGSLGVLLIQRSGFTASGRDLDAGVTYLSASHDALAAGHPYRIMAAGNLGGGLLSRFNQRGDTQDLDAARFYLETVGRLTGKPREDFGSLTADMDVVITANRGMSRAIEGMTGDLGAFEEAAAYLRTALAMAGPDHPHENQLRSDLALTLAMHAVFGEDAASLEAAGRELEAAVRTLPRNHLARPLALLRAGGALAMAGLTTGNAQVLRDAIGYLSRALVDIDPRFAEQVRFMALLGIATKSLYELTNNPADLDSAIAWLERARTELTVRPTHPQYANCLIQLAYAYRMRGDALPARETSLAALRGRCRDVLLQSGTARGIRFARIAAAEAAEVAACCLDDGRPAVAVEAIELGRGLILHAATAVTELPDLLVEAGDQELADEWRTRVTSRQHAPWDAWLPGPQPVPAMNAIAGTAQLQVPDDLRARALAALNGSAAEARLLTPPTLEQIAAALDETNADVLVYLLAPGDGGRGRAILVPAASLTRRPVAEEIPLPLLREGQNDPLSEYKAAYAGVFTSPKAGSGHGDVVPSDQETARRSAARRWYAALTDLCSWAWPTVMQPVLRQAQRWAPGRPPRLVLVTGGPLSLVPWHAARSVEQASTMPRYALADAVISYAASARQLVDVASRAARPLSADPVIIGDPTDSLPGALREARAIYERCYPHGRYLGPGWSDGEPEPDGSGTPRDVLRQLPATDHIGASMLHLACHGNIVGSAPGRSYLLLDGGRLRVDAVLRQAGRRPRRAPGGTVSLAACTSDLSADKFDEALTLATAFLAAGAVTVTGARWKIPDDTTSLLMFMFHLFMTAHGCSPRDALRRAQLWMIDPDRIPPPEMPTRFAGQAADKKLTSPVAWAGFVHQGR